MLQLFNYFNGVRFMANFFLKHPTRKDFWCKSVKVGLDHKACRELDSIEKAFKQKDTPLYTQALEAIAKLKKTRVNTYSDYWEIVVRAPASFGADSAAYAQAYESIDSVKNSLIAAFQLEENYKEVLAILEKIGVPPSSYTELSKNPFNKISIWKKPLKENNFDMVAQDNEARLYKTKAYAVFVDSDNPGYFAGKKANGRAASLSDAQLFGTLTLAQRQKAKLGQENVGIVEVDIKFKKIVDHPAQSHNILKIQSYYDKEAITDFLANHDVDKIKEEIAKSENLSPEEVVKKKNKI